MKCLALAVGLVSLSSVQAQGVSTDGSCGGYGSIVCKGSGFGDCCSQYGWCGSSAEYCSTGCQLEYGTCSSSESTLASSTLISSADAPPTGSGAQSALQCLQDKSVPYKSASDADYSDLIKPYNTRLPYTPAVMVFPTTNQHVQDAVICAAQSGLKVQAKSGGHSYASMGLGGQNGSMSINLRSFQTVEVDPSTGIATVGGGVRIGNLADGLWNQGRRSVSQGTCAGIGIGGHYTHGGYGHTSRNYGLAMDQIVAVDVVLANGTLVKASWTAYPDIFWAVRGAAESFGIVTTFYLQTRPAPDSITYFAIPFQGVNSKAIFTNALLHLQSVAQNASIVDDKLSFGIYLDNYGSFSLSGAYFGSVQEFHSQIQPELLRSLPPATPTVESLTWYDYLVKVSGTTTIKTSVTGYDLHQNFFAKSLTVPESDGLDESTLDALYDHLQTANTVQYYIIINLYGGPGSAINANAKKDPRFAAYSDRDSLWVLQNSGTNATSMPFINGINEAIIKAQPRTRFGAYLNYIDPSYDAPTAHRVYYGDAVYARLAALKKVVDPQRVFWNPLAIGA
ncbi:hypothetical protein ACEQ8H_005038 [Pleosporales sp. CAS-2024a]